MCSHRQFDRFKHRAVMSCPNNTITRTRHRHFGKLEDRVIGRGKLTVNGEARYVRILQVTRGDRLLIACWLMLWCM